MGKPTFHIKAEEVTDPSQAILLMTAGGSFFSFALMNTSVKEIVEFGYYSVSNDNDNSWNDFFAESEVLSDRYAHVAIAFNSPESILLPSAHFKIEESQLQADTIFGKNFQTIVNSDLLSEWEMVNIYRIPESLHAAVSRRFPSARQQNINSLLLNNSSKVTQNSILVEFRTNEFSVIVFNENVFHLAKSFSYSTPEDVLYYLLKICQEYKLSQQEVELVLAGLIERDSAIFRELYKYFIHLEFDELPLEFSIADALVEYPRHYFSTISKLAKCVL